MIHRFTEICRRHGLRAALRLTVYRALRSVCGIHVVHVLGMETSDVEVPSQSPDHLEYRFLTAADVHRYAADPANDLDAALADRLHGERDFCFAAFDRGKLASYAWYATHGTEAEHTANVPLSFAADTAYLYKAFTHPDDRGKGLHPAGVRRALRALSPRGIRRLVCLVEYANWGSLASHQRIGCRRLGHLMTAGSGTRRRKIFFSVAKASGVRFSESRADTVGRRQGDESQSCSGGHSTAVSAA